MTDVTGTTARVPGRTYFTDQTQRPTIAAGTSPEGVPYNWAWNNDRGQWVRTTRASARPDPPSVIQNPTGPIGGGPQTGAGGNANQSMSAGSSRAIIKEFLNQINLPELEDLLYNILTEDQDYSATRLAIEVRRTPQYAARFPGMAERQQAGLVQISEAEYLRDERQYKMLMQAAGLPTGFYDAPSDFSRFIGRDVSPAEVGRRIQDGFLAVSQADSSVKDSLRAFYGVTDGELAAFFLDPSKAESLIMQQTATAQIGAAAAREGFGAATERLAAERMQRLGVTEQEASQAFGVLNRSRELLQPLERGETTLDVADTALGLTGRGGTEAVQRLATQQRRRTARFEGGGRFATQGGDVVGLQDA